MARGYAPSGRGAATGGRSGLSALLGSGAGLIQELLEQEVTEFLGRATSVRRSESDNDAGYRNGYAPP